MRSVVVVLPASMCAMMPMLRTFVRSVSTSCATSASRLLSVCCASSKRPYAGPAREGRVSPAVVGERLVGLGHLVGVLAALDRGAQAVAGVEDLVHEPVGHRLLA